MTDMAVSRSFELPDLVKKLVELGIALAAEPDLEALLERILSHARAVSGAEAGTIFVRDGDDLRFAVVQNDFLVRRLGETEMKRHLLSERLPLSTPSLCGHVALTGNVVNVMDASAGGQVGDFPFNQQIDRKTGYVTRSVLALPLRVAGGPILGVIELLNAVNDEAVSVAFDPVSEPLVRWCASLAAVALASRSHPLTNGRKSDRRHPA